MEKAALFPQAGGFLHGGDYNPEQWLDRPDILDEDIRMMKKAHVNTATLGVFSWSVYEPEEGSFHFDWLEEMMDRLYENGIYTVLATPSGARPAWLDAAYPEAMRVGKDGRRAHHGVRHNHCMTSPAYREKVRIIDRKLAERFGRHPGLLLWHVSNELGGECYCPLCVQKFQEYLAEKFHHNIEELNQAWWTTFWSHRYQDFTQIEPPFSNGEGSIMGLNLEWRRFTTWNMTDFMKEEIRVLKEVTPDLPVTANFMQLYPGLDYRKMAESLDVISWDSYPRLGNDYETLQETMAETSFHHAVMRSMKPEKPFMLMESTPGLVNWHPFNKVKRPGIHRLASLQAAACGSDTVQYFQWRKGRGSFEQYHGAIVDHLGRDDTRIFREVEQIGADLEKMARVTGTTVHAQTALLFDWDNRWAIQDVKALSEQTKQYEATCMDIYKAFLRMGVEMDVVPSTADLTPYRVVIAPMLYLLQKETARNLTSYVKQGGQLLATYFTGYVDENTLCYLGGFPGDGLSELFGVISEEIDTLYPSDRNAVRFADGTRWEVRDYAETLRVQDAEVLASYEEDFYAGTAAVTRKICGDGAAYYVAARVSAQEMSSLFRTMLAQAGIKTKDLPEGVEYHVRSGEQGSYSFYLNCGTQRAVIDSVSGTDLLRSKAVDGALTLEPGNVAIIETAQQV
ncbi:MAG: beta-galactosidase [Eubacteriales bacterium]|nr:beta-galactosidase [Eubacteriales bacterium]